MALFSAPGYSNDSPDEWGSVVENATAIPPRTAPISTRAPPQRYRTLHGAAIVGWLDDQPIRVWNAKFGRERVYCRRSSIDNPNWRRRSHDGKGWRQGDIELRQDEVAFADILPAQYAPDADASDLERDLAQCAPFMARLQDDSFAFEVNLMLRHPGNVRRHGVSERFGLSFGELGAMIAQLRNVGETYWDFKFYDYLPESPRADLDEVVRLLWEAGWRFVTPKERYDEHLAAWDLLRGYEGREGVVPQQSGPLLLWRLPGLHIRLPTAAEMAREDRPGLNTRYRLAKMARTGRISDRELKMLGTKSQLEFKPYEDREPAEIDEAKARTLDAELMAIEETAIAATIPGWSAMSLRQREEAYCPTLRKRLDALKQAGAITQDERLKLSRMFDWRRA